MFVPTPSPQVQQAVSFIHSNNVQYNTLWFDIESPPNWGTCTQNLVRALSNTSDTNPSHPYLMHSRDQPHPRHTQTTHLMYS